MSLKTDARNRLIKVIAATATAESKSVQEVWSDVNLAFVRKYGKNFDKTGASKGEILAALDLADDRQKRGKELMRNV